MASNVCQSDCISATRRLTESSSCWSASSLFAEFADPEERFLATTDTVPSTLPKVKLARVHNVLRGLPISRNLNQMSVDAANGGNESDGSFEFPATRCGITRKIHCGLEIYLTVNPRPDGSPGEIFVRLGKQGSTVSGLVQAWAVALSSALRRGVPWEPLRDKLRDIRFEPHTHEYTSIIDAITRNVDAIRDEFVRKNLSDSEQRIDADDETVGHI